MRARWLTFSLLAGLAACGPQRNEFAPACPTPGLVKPLDELTRSRGGSPDFRDLAIRARIADVGGKCSPGGKNTVNVSVQVIADATRGPALNGDTFQLPMFVAVSDGVNVLDKKLFFVPVTFPRNVDTARAVGPEIEMSLPVSSTRTAAAYGIVAGFELTPEEVAAARRARRR